MKSFLFKTPIIIILSFLVFGCYTQLKTVDRSDDGSYSPYYDEEYFATDTTALDSGIIQNFYFYGYPDYYGSYYDPWYWNPGSRWGVYLGFSWGWGDPYWYPGWYGGCCYPIISPYYGYPYYYYPPYYGYPYYPPIYGGRPVKYAKRPFDRRTPVTGRIVNRGGTGTTERGSIASGSTRIARRTSDRDAISRTNTTTDNGSRIIHRNVDGAKRISRSGVTTDRKNTRSSAASQRRTIHRSGKSRTSPGATSSSPGYKPRSSSGSKSNVNRGRNSSSGSSRSYSPRSRSSSSGSSGRSSGNSRSSGSSSKRSGGSSRSSSRK